MELIDVGFGYKPAEPILKGITLRLKGGSVLGLLGRTGSGKTTISRLLFRLYEAQSGQVCLGGADVRDYPSADLRQRIGIVTQEVQLFQGNVRDNMALFDPTVPDERLVESLRMVGLESWLDSLPDGLDNSPEMLAICREKAAKCRLRPLYLSSGWSVWSCRENTTPPSSLPVRFNW